MKSLVIALALALAMSVGAQTTTDERQQAGQQQTGTTNTQENTSANQGRATKQNVQSNEREKTRVNDQENANRPPGTRTTDQERVRTGERAGERAGTRVREQGGNVSHGTTVFRNGRETTENLNLHRALRDRNDVHFRIGTHDRDWWLRSYSIVLMDGCHYYLADNGCWYPAYGFDPSCDYPVGAVYCE
jgi:hypothetical protein